MYRQFYQGMELTHLPLFTLVLFVALFGAMLVRLFVLRKGKHYEAVAHMPLTDGARELHVPGSEVQR